jgi:Cys-tRNA(Pro)/Cys-tRNA(Cys) deacylase
MSKEEKTNVMRILDQKKINYTSYYYEVDLNNLDGIHVADSIHEAHEDVYKTLVCVSNTKKYYVYVINIEDELDLKKCAKVVSEKSIEMIQVKEISKVTGGYERGGTSPIGMKKLFTTIIDSKALKRDYIIISGGKRGTQVKLNPNDLIKLINAKFEDVIR